MNREKTMPSAGDKYQAFLLCQRLRNEMHLARAEGDLEKYEKIRREWLAAEIHYTAFR